LFVETFTLGYVQHPKEEIAKNREVAKTVETKTKRIKPIFLANTTYTREKTHADTSDRVPARDRETTGTKKN